MPFLRLSDYSRHFFFGATIGAAHVVVDDEFADAFVCREALRLGIRFHADLSRDGAARTVYMKRLITSRRMRRVVVTAMLSLSEVGSKARRAWKSLLHKYESNQT